MALIRWNPSRELINFHDEVDRLFDSLITRPGMLGTGQAFAPAAEIEETSENFVVRLDVPGISQKDVKVSLLGDTLTIRGERRQESSETKGTVHRTERSYGSFERSFVLGTAVRNEGVKATYRDGVLEVQVPKAEQARVREIEVQVS
jgi:HSP20 family protein